MARPAVLVRSTRGRHRAHRASRARGSHPGWPSSAPRSPASASRRRPSRRCSPPAGSQRRIDSRIADVRSRELLARHLREAQPEILFHLAAQALVTAAWTTR